MSHTSPQFEHSLLPVRHLVLIGATVLVAACEKSTPKTEDVPPKPSATSSVAVLSPSPSAPSPSAAVSASTPVAVASESVVATVDAGKGKDGGGATALKPASKHVNGSNFALDLGSPGCKAAAECAMTIKLVTSGDYHVNKEYPYKFIATATPGVEYLGKTDATTFTRAAGDFIEQGEKTGTMTVRFKPASPGEARISGTYKFSVCSADQCQIEQEKLDLSIPVM
jgi:hypothetical protein